MYAMNEMEQESDVERVETEIKIGREREKIRERGRKRGTVISHV